MTGTVVKLSGGAVVDCGSLVGRRVPFKYGVPSSFVCDRGRKGSVRNTYRARKLRFAAWQFRRIGPIGVQPLWE
jgi:hypothetical protein